MTLTKKIGVVLAFLAATPILGSIAFALFFAATAADALSWISSNVEHVLLQELYVQALTVRDGDDAARPQLIERTEGGTATPRRRQRTPHSIGSRGIPEFRVVFLDLMMPEVGGLNLIPLVRSRKADLPIVAMSVSETLGSP